MNKAFDAVGVVEGTYHAADGSELVMAVDLDGSGLLTGCFQFDEGDVVSGKDGESVWDAYQCGWVEFEADATVGFDGFFELLFDVLFTHWRTPLAGQGRIFSYIGLVLGILLPVSLFFLPISHKVLHLTFFVRLSQKHCFAR